jgi:hypothetical protein
MSSAAQYFLPAIPNATARSSTSPQAQTSDVKMFDAPDGGDIEIVNGRGDDVEWARHRRVPEPVRRQRR